MVRLGSLWRGATACLFLASAALGSGAAHAACGSLLPQPLPRPARAVSASDIIQMREIGYPDASLVGQSPLALSPDGTRIAFVLSRADIASNGYCRALVVVPLSGGTPRVIDTGGEFISLGNFVRGLWVDTGFPKLVTPVWSPDANSIALLKRLGGITQVAILSLDGSKPAVVTHLSSDAEDCWWGKEGGFYVATRSGAVAAAREVDKEGVRGWLYDARIAPNYGPRPRLRASDAPIEILKIDPKSAAVLAVAPEGAGPPDRSNQSTLSHSGERAWLERVAGSPFAPQQLWATGSNGQKVVCVSEHCRGRFLGLWWDAPAREVRFLRREGWNNENYAFYRWRPGSAAPTPVFSTANVIQNCVPANTKLACTFENSVTPPRIVLVDPKTGSWRTLFDPNPEFQELKIGSVRRLRFRNDRGLEAWADLVLPPDYRQGSKLPMIFVQYNSRGFLRGGTGNEYLVFPLAAEGFAVLSFERPRAVASADPTLKSDEELNAANERGWAERWSVLSATLAAVDAAVATGAIDRTRIGITGLSDGATSVRFALINSNRFAAAAISSCCLEPKTVMTYGGIAWAEFNRAVGYPPASLDASAFWAPMSIARNAARIETPLLMQLSDDEYLLSLEAFEALREKGAPAELYVFPDEHHVKWQPRHKLAIFERTADWFNFWLNCAEDEGPRKAGEYRRWENIRDRLGGSGCQPPIHVPS